MDILKIGILHPYMIYPTGTTFLVYNLANALSDLGKEVKVICGDFNQALFTSSELKFSIDTLNTPTMNTLQYWLLLPKILRKFKLALEKLSPDVIIPHSFPLGAIKVRKSLQAFYLHEPFQSFYNPLFFGSNFVKKFCSIFFRTIFRPFDKKMIRESDIVFVNSYYTKKRVKEVYNLNSYVIYPALDPDLINYAESKSLKNDTLNEIRTTILVVGPSNPLKNFHLSLFVYKELKKEIPNLQLIVTGLIHPPLIPQFRRFSLKYKGDIAYYSHISKEKLFLMMDQASVILYPSINEPFGLVPIEGISLDTPVVGFKGGGIDETIGKIFPDLLVPPFDVVSLVEASRLAISRKKENYYKSGLKKLIIHSKYSFSYIEMAKRLLVYINKVI